jgi:hypothetical protein
MADTSLLLTGLHVGFRLNLTGKAGIAEIGQARAANIGYALETTQSSDGKSFNVVTFTSEQSVDDPPDIVLSAYYTQNAAYEEVDLAVRYSDIPDGTILAVGSTMTALSLQRQSIRGTGMLGQSMVGRGAFSTALELKLWGLTPASLRPTSSVTLSLSNIESGGVGPVKRVVREKLVLRLMK